MSQQQPTGPNDGLTAATWRPSRRVMVKAAAAFAALAGMGGAARSDLMGAVAQNSGGTLARRWSEVDEIGDVSVAAAGDYRTITAEFPFYAVGGSWAGGFGTNAVLELRFSSDGTTYGAPVRTGPALVDAGRPDRDNRIFVNLVFTDGARYIRYRVLDGGGTPVVAPDLEVVYIDATNGPQAGDVFAPAALPTLRQPPIVSRAGWGANEDYRFDAYGEVWPPEYRKVEHIIIHHTDTPNNVDGPSQVRSIYYYHAVERLWGDIGYNYLVDHNGTIYLGRVGGPHVVGGHAYKYAYGSSGIATLGTFSGADASEEAQAALVAISAWVGRNLQPLGKATFHEAANLPTICGHRDVSQSDCPGDYLWADLPGIRRAVADLLADTESPPDDPVPGFPPGTYITGTNAVTDRQLGLREFPSTSSASIATLSAGTYCAIYGLPRIVNGVTWYYVLTTNHEGYLQGQYLDRAPAGTAPAAKFKVGDRVRVTQDVSLRRDPGIPQRITGTLFADTVVQVTVASVVATGIRWWGVYDPNTTGGWVNQNFLVAANLPALYLSRGSGVPGTTITFELRRFPANRSVSIQWDGVTKLSVTTDGTGTATGTYKIPSAVKGGHTLRAVVGSSSASTPFQVLSGLSLSPKQGPTRTKVTLTFRGFAPGERIQVQWKTGTTWNRLKTLTSSSVGSATMAVTTVSSWAGKTVTFRGVAPSGTAQANFVATTPVPRSLTLSPTQGPTRTKVTMTFSGFVAGEGIQVQWKTDDTWNRLRTLTASSTGGAAMELTTVSSWAGKTVTFRGLAPSGEVQATFVATSTASASEDRTPTPRPTRTPEPAPENTPTPTPEPTETPTPQPTETPTPEPTETPTPEPTPTEMPTETPTEEPTATPTETPAE
jgi:hypothetical protein